MKKKGGSGQEYRNLLQTRQVRVRVGSRLLKGKENGMRIAGGGREKNTRGLAG